MLSAEAPGTGALVYQQCSKRKPSKQESPHPLCLLSSQEEHLIVADADKPVGRGSKAHVHAIDRERGNVACGRCRKVSDLGLLQCKAVAVESVEEARQGGRKDEKERCTCE